MRTIEDTLALWKSGLLSDEEVVSWAGKAMMALPAHPPELMDLVTDGPRKCMQRAQIDFPVRPTEMSYQQQFSVRAVSLDLTADDAVAFFADWASRHSMGGDPSDPFVRLGYELEHLLVDCQDVKAAIAHARQALPVLILRCRVLAAQFVEAEA